MTGGKDDPSPKVHNIPIEILSVGKGPISMRTFKCKTLPTERAMLSKTIEYFTTVYAGTGLAFHLTISSIVLYKSPHTSWCSRVWQLGSNNISCAELFILPNKILPTGYYIFHAFFHLTMGILDGLFSPVYGAIDSGIANAGGTVGNAVAGVGASITNTGRSIGDSVAGTVGGWGDYATSTGNYIKDATGAVGSRTGTANNPLGLGREKDMARQFGMDTSAPYRPSLPSTSAPKAITGPKPSGSGVPIGQKKVTNMPPKKPAGANGVSAAQKKTAVKPPGVPIGQKKTPAKPSGVPIGQKKTPAKPPGVPIGQKKTAVKPPGPSGVSKGASSGTKTGGVTKNVPVSRPTKK